MVYLLIKFIICSVPEGWKMALAKILMKYWDSGYHPLHSAHEALTMIGCECPPMTGMVQGLGSGDILLLRPFNLMFACFMTGHYVIPLVTMPYRFVGISIVTLTSTCLNSSALLLPH